MRRVLPAHHRLDRVHADVDQPRWRLVVEQKRSGVDPAAQLADERQAVGVVMAELLVAACDAGVLGLGGFTATR